MPHARAILRLTLATLALAPLAACGDLSFGDKVRPDVRKETSPLTLPPAAVRNGTARDQ